MSHVRRGAGGGGCCCCCCCCCCVVVVVVVVVVVFVKILDETRMSLSVKEERLVYINVPRRNTYESRDEIISI
jgi:hypothetical protein